jgi:hypothetical protein
MAELGGGASQGTGTANIDHILYLNPATTDMRAIINK